MKQILFLGCGKMGSILLDNLLQHGIASHNISVIKNTDKNKISKIKYYKSHTALPAAYKADLVFIAIKPQEAKEILSDFAKAKIFHAKTIFISILAGKKINFFEKIFGDKAKIVRSMPNLPIQYSQGIMAYSVNKNITKVEEKNIATIFESFGTCLHLKNEKDFDNATAIFGCGPAYIFYLQEIFQEIAISFGLNKQDALQLVKQLFLGSVIMSCNDNDFSKLRESVTSKAGVTEAALKVLQKNSALNKLFKSAIKAAVSKSKEFSNG